MPRSKISYNKWTRQSLEEHNKRRLSLKRMYEKRKKRRITYESKFILSDTVMVKLSE